MLAKQITYAILTLSLTLSVTGLQFITGACSKDSECASACCGFNSGKCAGPVIAQTRDGGCGRGDAQPNDRAAKAFFAGQSANGGATTFGTITTSAATAGNTGASSGSGKAPGTQFITGPCAGDVDCASGCCGFRTGKCAGAIIAQQRDGGCGFGSGTPNADAAKKLGFTGTPGQG